MVAEAKPKGCRTARHSFRALSSLALADRRSPAGARRCTRSHDNPRPLRGCRNVGEIFRHPSEAQCTVSAEIGPTPNAVTRSRCAEDSRTGRPPLAQVVWIHAAESGRDGDLALQDDPRSASSKPPPGESASRGENRLQDPQYHDRARDAGQLLCGLSAHRQTPSATCGAAR